MVLGVDASPRRSHDRLPANRSHPGLPFHQSFAIDLRRFCVRLAKVQGIQGRFALFGKDTRQ